MQMISARHAGCAGEADDIFGGDHVAHGHIDLAQMGVEAADALTVVDHDHVAVDAEIVSENDLAAVGGLDVRMLG